MKFERLNPSQVITTRDFPVYSTKVLEKYFEIYRSGNGVDLPPVPIMHKDLVLPHFDAAELALLKEYLKQNPQAVFFLLNGSHRTTSVNLTGHSINGILLSTKEDIKQVNHTKFRGEKYEHRLDSTILGNIKELIDHFKGTDMFQTVQQKTDKMVDERVIPHYMIEHYRSIGANQ